MTNVQLADNVRAFASTRPNLQTAGVGGALINYLRVLWKAPIDMKVDRLIAASIRKIDLDRLIEGYLEHDDEA
jgi:hypothetical protein